MLFIFLIFHEFLFAFSCKDLKKNVINITEEGKFDIVIEGLGFFSVKKGSYVIHTLNGTNVFVRKAMI